MSEPPHDDPPGTDPGGVGPGVAPPAMPTWVKVSALVVGVLVLVVLLVMLVVGGDHGPGRHMSGSAALIDRSAPWPDQPARQPRIGA